MYRNPASTVDIAVVKNNSVILIKRKHDPFHGKLAFPGGFVDYGEPVEETARREIKEETGMQIELIDILGIYSAPNRDPRAHTITTVFVARPVAGTPQGADDAAEAKWVDIDSVSADDLAFDHAQILDDLRNWLRTKSGTYWSGKERKF